MFSFVFVDSKDRPVTQSLIRYQGNMDQVLAVSFSPFDSHQLVTCGKQHVTFWELEDNKLKQSRGRLSVSYTLLYAALSPFSLPESCS